MRKLTVNTLSEGMFLDINTYSVPNNVLTDCLNATVITNNANERTFQNDMGNTRIKKPNSDDEYISLQKGFIPLAIKEYGNVVFIISGSLKDNGTKLDKIEFGSYPSIDKNGNYVEDYNPFLNLTNNIKEQNEVHSFIVDNDSTFKFTLNNPIQIECTPEYDRSVNLIITDGVNVPKLINSRFSLENGILKVQDRNENSDTNIYPDPIAKEHSPEMFLNSIQLQISGKKIPNLELVDVNFNYGNLKCGNYTCYFKYIDIDGNESPFIAESGPVSIAIGQDEGLRGGFEDEVATKSIHFKLSNLDPGQRYIGLYYIRNTSSIDGHVIKKYVRVLNKYDIIDTECDILLTGYEDNVGCSESDINLQYNLIDSAETEVISNNVVFFGNVKLNSNVNYQNLKLISKQIYADPVVRKLENFELSYKNFKTENNKQIEVNNYRNPKFSYYNTGYQFNEYYRFGIVYIFENGNTSSVFDVCGNVPMEDSKIIGRNEKGVVKINNFLDQESGTYKQNSEIDEFTHIFSIHFNIGNDIINSLKSEGVSGYFFVRLKRVPIKQATGFSIDWDYQSGLPCIDRVFETPFVCNLYWGRQIRSLYPDEDGLDVNTVEEKDGNPHGYKYIRRWNDRYENLSLTKFITLRLLPEGSWSKSASYIDINSVDPKDIENSINQWRRKGSSDLTNGLVITNPYREKIPNYFPKLTDLSKIKFPELPGVYDERFQSRRLTYGSRAIGWNKYGYSHLIYEFNQYKARYINPHVLICPEYDVDPGKINSMFVGNEWYLKRRYITKNGDEGYFYKKNTIDTACWSSSDWWSKTPGTSADDEEELGLFEKITKKTILGKNKNVLYWENDLSLYSDEEESDLDKYMNIKINFTTKSKTNSVGTKIYFNKDINHYSEFNEIDFNIDLYKQEIVTEYEDSKDSQNPKEIKTIKQILIGNLKFKYTQSNHTIKFISGYTSEKQENEWIKTNVTPVVTQLNGCQWGLPLLLKFLNNNVYSFFFYDAFNTNNPNVSDNIEMLFPEWIYLTLVGNCTSDVINTNDETDDQSEEFGRLLKVKLKDLSLNNEYLIENELEVENNMKIKHPSIIETKLVAVDDGHKNVNIVTNQTDGSNPIHWSFNAIAGSPEQREQSSGFSSVFAKLNSYYLFDGNEAIKDDQGTSQYIDDPKEPECCIGLKDYKGDKPKDDRASVKYYRMHRSNLVRGLWYPYVGCTERLTRDSIYDIYSKEINTSEENIAKVRSQIRYPYFAISDRYSIDNVDNNRDYYRGDSYICLFTHRLNRNFQGMVNPLNDKIVDLDTYRYYAVETNSITVPFSSLSELRKEGEESKGADYPNTDDLNAVRLGRWIEFPCISSENLNIRTLNHAYNSEQGITGLKRGFYPYYPISTSGNTKIPESGCHNSGYNVSTGDKSYINQGDISFINSDYTNRVLYSNIQVTDSFVNGNRVFISDNCIDYTKKYGKIIKMEEFYNKIYVIMEHGVGVLPLNEKYLTGSSGENNVYVKSGHLIPEEMTIISDTFGSLYKDSIIKTQYGIYGIDTIKKVIWRCGQETKFETLSDTTIKSFLLKSLDLVDGEIKIGIKNIKSHYNKLKGDIMFTFYDYTNNQTKPWNLCYNEYTLKFTTFYSWIPSNSENIGNTFISFDNDSTRKIINSLEKEETPFLYKHGTDHLTGSGKIKPCYWYDKQHPFEFEFVVTGEGIHKIFDNLLIISNNAEPESFHYEIIGDCFDFAKEKENAYVRQELVKRVYNSAKNKKGQEVLDISKKLYVNDKDLELIPKLLLNVKSASFPLYYSRIDTPDEIDDSYKTLKSDNKNYKYLAGTEIIKDDLLNEYHLLTHAKAVDINKTGLLRGNMRYTEDKWNVVINPINVVYKNEEPWRNNHIPITVNNSPIPNINNQELNFSIPEELVEKFKYDNRDIDYSRWNDGDSASFMNTREQVDQRDKWIKIRIRYSGKKLAIIHQIITEYRQSFA